MSCICAIINHIFWIVLVVMDKFKWSVRLLIMVFKEECSRLVGS